MTKPTAVLSFSSGKDSLWALHVAKHEYDVVAMLTTITEPFDRVAMHGVRRDLLDAQAQGLDLPLVTVPLPYPCSNEEYEERLSVAIDELKGVGVSHMIFGDLFLEDIKVYREQQMAELNITPVFPLWLEPTNDLAREMVEGGVEATIVCLDPKRLPASFAGRPFDAELLDRLPADVDPCGENGEFHTVVTAGPGFSGALSTTVGEVVERDGFVFADVLLNQ